MNPDLDTTPGLGLPQPSVGMGQMALGRAPDTFSPSGAAPARFDAAPSPMPPVAAAPMAQPFATPSTNPIPTSLSQGTDVPNDDIADETALDLEWVGKAREIVERTHADPYIQSRELSRAKAQYIKARYNKEVKISEDQQ
jgi:hypothetical protein